MSTSPPAAATAAAAADTEKIAAPQAGAELKPEEVEADEEWMAKYAEATAADSADKRTDEEIKVRIDGGCE